MMHLHDTICNFIVRKYTWLPKYVFKCSEMHTYAQYCS